MQDKSLIDAVWIDTNIIIYYLRYNKNFSPKVQELITAANNGEFKLKISPMVISECVFVLMGKQFYCKKQEIKMALSSFINMPGVEMEEKEVILEALDNYSKKGIDFTDAYIAAHAKSLTPAYVVTENIKDFKGLNVTVETTVDFQDMRKAGK